MTKYKGYEITTGDSIFGPVAFRIEPLPGTKSCFSSATVWSMADAKRAVRVDIKQAHCPHDQGEYEHGHPLNRYLYCKGCNKIRGRVPPPKK